MPIAEFLDEPGHSCSNKPMPPCKSCPWRKDARASDIPNFSMAMAESLRDTSPNERGVGPDFGSNKMACHQSRVGEEFVCAGWLASVGHAHPGVRLSILAKTINPASLAPGADWPALHESYPEVLEKLRQTLGDRDDEGAPKTLCRESRGA
jgi:hypothetical protein